MHKGHSVSSSVSKVTYFNLKLMVFSAISFMKRLSVSLEYPYPNPTSNSSENFDFPIYDQLPVPMQYRPFHSLWRAEFARIKVD